MIQFDHVWPKVPIVYSNENGCCTSVPSHHLVFGASVRLHPLHFLWLGLRSYTTTFHLTVLQTKRARTGIHNTHMAISAILFPKLKSLGLEEYWINLSWWTILGNGVPAVCLILAFQPPLLLGVSGAAEPSFIITSKVFHDAQRMNALVRLRRIYNSA